METGSSIPDHNKTKQNSPLSALRSLCPDSYSIDVDHYFEILKLQCASYDKPKISQYQRASSSDDELLSEMCRRRKKRSSSNPPSLRRRTSTSALLYPLDNQSFTTHHQTYDHQVDKETGELVVFDKKSQEDFLLERQKSWDLHLSKKKGSCEICTERVSKADCSLAQAFGVSNACTITSIQNNNLISLACKCSKELLLDELYTRHLESAIVHGKINSVSQQNRRKRRKYFDKEKSKCDPEVDDICGALEERLSLN